MMKMKRICIVLMLLAIAIVFDGCRNSAQDEMELIESLAAMHQEEYTEEDDGYEPIARAPTQEELIKEHGVKLKRSDYDDGDYEISHYNKDGLLTKHEFFNGELIVSEYVYELDSTGNVLKKVETEKDGNSIHEFRYDSKGREIERQFSYKGGEPQITTYVYDDKAHTKTEENLTGKYVTHYDYRGLDEKMISYNEDGQQDAAVYYTNDEAGNRVSEEASLMGIKVIDKMKYNERGQLLRKDRGGLVEVIMIYEYDEKGLCTSFDRQKGTLPSKVLYTYEYY